MMNECTHEECNFPFHRKNDWRTAYVVNSLWREYAANWLNARLSVLFYIELRLTHFSHIFERMSNK